MATGVYQNRVRSSSIFCTSMFAGIFSVFTFPLYSFRAWSHVKTEKKKKVCYVCLFHAYRHCELFCRSARGLFCRETAVGLLILYYSVNKNCCLSKSSAAPFTLYLFCYKVLHCLLSGRKKMKEKIKSLKLTLLQNCRPIWMPMLRRAFLIDEGKSHRIRVCSRLARSRNPPTADDQQSEGYPLFWIK